MQWLGKDGYRVGDLHQFAVVGEGFLRSPGLQEHLQRFPKALSGFRDVATKACHLVGLVTASDPTEESAVDKVVEHRDLFGQAQWFARREE